MRGQSLDRVLATMQRPASPSGTAARTEELLQTWQRAAAAQAAAAAAQAAQAAAAATAADVPPVCRRLW